MNWLMVVGIVLGFVIVCGVVAKLMLRRRLAAIDGLAGIHQGDQNIVGCVGEQTK